ncbi:MAG TPA: hypothetical protein VNL70_02615 [Tepidisphaeraceae bacterium]|nr:hypothetical protein [Tepidisphaeraceae bacterium]
MRNSPDPSVHQAREQQFMAHVEQLLSDSRLIVDTTAGRRAVPNLFPQATRSDRGTDLKRLMSELNLPDRQLQSRMPVGQSMQVTLRARKWWILSRVVGRIQVQCVSPTRALLLGETPKPLDLQETRRILNELPAGGAVPTTVVLLSTSGFEINAREAASRSAERTVILVEPNDAGGWSSYGPVQTKALVDLFDPELEQHKRQRVQQAIQAGTVELLGGGIAADKIAAKTQLPLSFVEAEVKSYARQNPGLAAKRLDGRVVLYREGSVPGAVAASAAGAADMPLIDRIKSLFNRKGDTERKIAFLAERKAALAQQRDRCYEDIAALEQQDEQLRQQFKQSSSGITRRRITSQLVQLRKDIERRQQMLQVLNQQINIVGTHLHNLELTQQGQTARLPDSEQIASDAAAAEQMLAQLQADNELADSVGAVAHAGMTEEEQALYEQLEREAGGPATTRVQLDHAEPLLQDESPAAEPKPASRPPQRRAEPEAG